MAQGTLKGMKVAALVTDLFEQVELTEPKKALESAGAEVHIIAPEAGKVQGANHDEKADEFEVDRTLADARAGDYDAVLLPGGTFSADNLRIDSEAKDFVKGIDEAHKPIAVICHGSWLLVSADLVNGRTLTSFETLQDDIRNAGGDWVDQEFVRDANWVSSRKPDDLPAFNRDMVALFAEHKAVPA